MTTFLLFLCRGLLGPPSRDRGDGAADWSCPQCGGRKFGTRPHKPPYKDRFRCWSCQFRGDEHDLLRHFFPREDYGERQARLADLREEYERWLADNPQGLPVAEPSGPALSLSSPGTGGQGPAPDPRLARRVAQAWAALSDEERELLGRAAHVALGRFRENPEALVSYAYSFWLWEHVAREEAKAVAARRPRTPAEAGEALRASRNGKA